MDNQRLSEQQVLAYRNDGLVWPLRVLSAKEAQENLALLEAYEARNGAPVAGRHRYKSHLLFPWISKLMRDPRILDLIEDVIGPDILVWTTHLYPKDPGDKRFISWHQDAAHWGLDSDRIVTAWIALSDATEASGCMRMLPGSHQRGVVEHHDTWDKDNILTRGQTISEEIDESRAVSVELSAGEISLHHVNMWHASNPNEAHYRRVGLAIRYITPGARQQRVAEDYATLVRGEDRHGHFLPEPEPTSEFAPELVALHNRIADIQGQIYLSGTQRAGIGGLRETNASS
ncbi:MAG: phytanoyl-CoA dioxygenase family protein [Gammaproteobacteria bacterium]|nr:phytanoyl-CoA dioxygenase family protein [Gammaproteobacteria bacterium]